jgi:Tfp pilus assembly protein PilN/8-oxo-dGTP pyrophosphatase MutT (NUDIX family)
MHTIGISITRDRIFSVALDASTPSLRVAAAVSVPCSEPFGTAGDAVSLSEALREALPGVPFPGAVLTLPPPITFLRPMTLPVTDRPRAKAIHLAELEGNLPIEDEDILSDLLPAPPDGTGLFFAVAARKTFVESASEQFGAAGIRMDRVVTDPVALLLLAPDAAGTPRDGIYLSTFNDVLLLRLSGGGITAARQFPQAMADRPEELLVALRESAEEAGAAPLPVFLIGEIPTLLADALPDAERVPLPEGVSPAHLAAYGAALAPLRPDVGGGFSLRTSAEAALERERDRRWKLATGIAAGVAVLLVLGAFTFASWAEGEKASRARALVKKEFAVVAPEIRNVVQAGTQIRAKLDSLRRQQKELGTDAPPPADLLQLASRALPKGDIAVREISIEGGRLRIAGDAGSDARLVEAYRAGLAGAFGPDYSATVQESGGSVKGTSLKFTILVEKKVDRRAS